MIPASRLASSRILCNTTVLRNNPVHARPTRLVQSKARGVTSSANPFPFPANAHPTPHQIFHLPASATRDEVKKRYYDLVRIYHPDSAISRAVPPETAHSRFQAISAAYAVLSGKAHRMEDADTAAGSEGLRPDYHSLSTAMWRAKQRKRAELDVGMDDRWKERLLMSAVVLSLGMFVWQTWSARRQAATEAMERVYSRPVQTIPKERRRTPSDDHELLAEPTPVEKSTPPK